MRTLLICLLLPVGASAQDLDGGTPLAPPITPVEASPAPLSGPTVTAKYGAGVTVKQGDFSLNVRARVQVQALTVIPTDDSTAARQNNFLVRRARVAIKGTAPYHLSFSLQLGLAALDMEPDAPNVLRDFYIDWKPLRDLNFRFGQTKVPFAVQRVISSSSQSFVDRSTVTLEFNLDRDVGLIVSSQDLFGLGGRVRYHLGVFGGDGRNRTVANVGLLYVARLRLSNIDWDEAFEGDPERNPRLRVALAGAAAYNVATNRPRSTLGTPYKSATFDYAHAEGDLQVKWRGAALLAELSWRRANQDQVGTEYSRSGLGWFVQGGYYVLPWLEFVARYGELRPAAGTDPSFGRSRELGGGINFMILAHDLKVQADYFWLDDGVGGNGRHQVRVQMQVFF